MAWPAKDFRPYVAIRTYTLHALPKAKADSEIIEASR
jgi:hypothetical protein